MKIEKKSKEQVFEKEIDIKHFTKPSSADVYVVRGKTEPSAKLWNYWGQQKGIKTKILQYKVTEEYAEILMAGWVGDFNNPQLYAEELVRITYEYEAIKVLLAKMERANNARKYGKTYYDPSGIDWSKVEIKVSPNDPSKAIFNDAKAQIEYWKQLISLKIYGSRNAVTKAQTRLYRKLLGGEFREKTEIELEKEEVEEILEKKTEYNTAVKQLPTTGTQEENENIETKEESKVSDKQIKLLWGRMAGNKSIEKELKQVFGIEHLKDLPANRMEDALKWIENRNEEKTKQGVTMQEFIRLVSKVRSMGVDTTELLAGKDINNIEVRKELYAQLQKLQGDDKVPF